MLASTSRLRQTTETESRYTDNAYDMLAIWFLSTKLVAELQRAEERQPQTKALPALKLGIQFTDYVEITQQLAKDRDTDMQNEIVQRVLLRYTPCTKQDAGQLIAFITVRCLYSSSNSLGWRRRRT
jgi:hypothetical protein